MENEDGTINNFYTIFINPLNPNINGYQSYSIIRGK